MNQTHIIGNLTADPQLRTANTASGPVSVCSFAIAVNEKRGEQEQTTFFNCAAWRQLGEIIARYARKGHKLYVGGKVKARAYMKSDGTPGSSLELTVEDFEFLTSRSEGQQPTAQPAPVPAPIPVDTDDELPF
jgi:single-strand DNA-binding protein